MTETVGVETGRKPEKPEPQVPFHLPGIRKPQIEHRMSVDNSNKPFVHVDLERSADGTRFLHPLEEFDVRDFVDRTVVDEPVMPLALDDTPFLFVQRIEDLKVLKERLEVADVFAIDLEHNHFRSFHGLTCLMQISTRKEDFIVDTLKLRAHVGPYLREVFRDPSKRKVMHGADSDILWLQKDFGIYVCNMFDTGQASRVLKLERKSLKYLLQNYCGITANKEYQTSDWRIRPLPYEMVKYAREDTHYLLYLYDVMRRDLISALSTPVTENNDTLFEVYKQSFNICLQLYEKELFDDTSYLSIRRLSAEDFNSEQLAVVAGLYEWRDRVARTEDESIDYILPNKALLEIARHMPLSPGKLRHLVKSRYPIVISNLNLIIRIITKAIHSASAFENISKQLKKKRLESIMQATELKKHGSNDIVNSLHAVQKHTVNDSPTPTNNMTRMNIEKQMENGRLITPKPTIMQATEFKKHGSNDIVNSVYTVQNHIVNDSPTPANNITRMNIDKQMENDRLITPKTTDTVKSPVQMLAKPSGALEIKSSKKKLSPHFNRRCTGKKEAERKNEASIRFSRNSTSRPFPGHHQSSKVEPVKIVEACNVFYSNSQNLRGDCSSTKQSTKIIDIESSTSERSTKTVKSNGCHLKNQEHSSKQPSKTESREIINIDSSSSSGSETKTLKSNCLKHRELSRKHQETIKSDSRLLEMGTSTSKKDFKNESRYGFDSATYFEADSYECHMAGEQVKSSCIQNEDRGFQGPSDCNLPTNSTDSFSTFTWSG